MVSGSGKLLCPLPKFSLLSNLLLSSSWSGVESKSQCQTQKQLGAYLTFCQFFSLMYSLWAPSLKLTLKGSSSVCLSSLPSDSSGRDWGTQDQDNNEQRPGAETWAGNMRGLYIGEGILRSLVKLLIVPEQKNSKQFIQHMLGLYNLFCKYYYVGTIQNHLCNVVKS